MVSGWNLYRWVHPNLLLVILLDWTLSTCLAIFMTSDARPLIGQLLTSSASYWSGVDLCKVQMCSKVAGRFSSGYCSVNQISSTLDIFIWYFFHFPNVLGPLSYPREGSREAINCVRVTNSQVFYQWLECCDMKQDLLLISQSEASSGNTDQSEACVRGYRMMLIKLEDPDLISSTGFPGSYLCITSPPQPCDYPINQILLRLKQEIIGIILKRSQRRF